MSFDHDLKTHTQETLHPVANISNIIKTTQKSGNFIQILGINTNQHSELNNNIWERGKTALFLRDFSTTILYFHLVYVIEAV